MLLELMWGLGVLGPRGPVGVMGEAVMGVEEGVLEVGHRIRGSILLPHLHLHPRPHLRPHPYLHPYPHTNLHPLHSHLHPRIYLHPHQHPHLDLYLHPRPGSSSLETLRSSMTR